MKKSNRSSIYNKLRYEFDKTVSRGPLALSAWLALFALLVISILSTITNLTGIFPAVTLPGLFWNMMMQSMAPNPIDYRVGPLPYLLIMLVVTLMGIFMVSIFIGIITTSIDNKITSLRRGRSLVIEKDHTVILGWDEHIFTILSELITAYEHHRRSCIVILGDKDKIEMEEEIRSRIKHTGRTEIICRSGNPLNMIDLDIVSINTSKSIIILGPDLDEPDTHVIKVLLAITNNPQRRSEPYHIVTEIYNPLNMDVAHLVGRDECILLPITDIIAHIISQTCRQTGLSSIYTELLNFSGDEIYFTADPSLVGKTFRETLSLYEDSSVIGLWPKDDKPRLNPPMDTPINPGDQLIVVTEDDSSARLSTLNPSPVQPELVRLGASIPPQPEATMILGWGGHAATIIRELDKYVAAGSRVMVVTNNLEPETEVAQLGKQLEHQALSFQTGNITDRHLLDSLALETFDHVIVLADLSGLPLQVADARTLITLLHLRDINEKHGLPFSIVSEMLDVRNRKLAEVTRVDDFIVSDELASLLMAQISEDKELNLVFENLFYPEGSEIYLKPMGNYIALGEPVNFYTVIEAASQRGEVAMGYRIAADVAAPEKSFGVVVNPDKSPTVVFQKGDRVIVMAEN